MTPNTTEACIKIEKISLQMGDSTIYDQLSLDILPAEIFFLLGPSGCGKSTLLRLISGLIGPDSGNISINGQTPDLAWSEFAFVFQSPRLVGWRNALQNATLGAQLRFGGPSKKYEKRATELLQRLGLGHDLHKLPSALSGGERQRVAIARAFLLDPPIILMDEPFSALDLKTREHLRREVEALWKTYKKTIIFVTHDIDDALTLADRIVVLAPKPAQVVADIHVSEPRPRELDSLPIQQLRHQIEALLTQ